MAALVRCCQAHGKTQFLLRTCEPYAVHLTESGARVVCLVPAESSMFGVHRHLVVSCWRRSSTGCRRSQTPERSTRWMRTRQQPSQSSREGAVPSNDMAGRLAAAVQLQSSFKAAAQQLRACSGVEMTRGQAPPSEGVTAISIGAAAQLNLLSAQSRLHAAGVTAPTTVKRM